MPDTSPKLSLPRFPIRWIETLGIPSWDAYFMSMVFLAAMRSPDQETKQGCVIVDWKSKVTLGTGYNGHPRNSQSVFTDNGATEIKLPTKRPGKYACMVHADTNAIVNCRGSSDNAVVYLPMPPCEVCLGVMANHPTVLVKRIVYLEYRHFPATEDLAHHLPHITFEQYKGPHPAEALLNAAKYAMLRTTQSSKLSANSTKSYSKGAV